MKKSNLLWVSIVSALVLTAFRFSYFVSYLSSPLIPGSDTVGHVELGTFYAAHIFPSVWGWAQNWFGGMPFSAFYPPLFTILTTIFSKIVFINYDHALRIMLVLLTLMLPGMLALVTSALTKNKGAQWISGLAGVFLLLTPFGTYDNLGVSLGSTFVVGLTTHILAFILLLGWVWAFLESIKSRRAYFLSIIFMAGTALASEHTIPVVMILWAVGFCVREYGFFRNPHTYLQDHWSRNRLVKYYILPGVLALGLMSFWLIPFFQFYPFMPSQSLGLQDGIGARDIWAIVHSWWPTAAFLIFTFIIALRKREKPVWILLLGTCGIFLAVFLNLNEVFQRIPFHLYRILPFVYFSGAIFAGWVFDKLSLHRTKKIRWALGSIILVIFFIPVLNHLYIPSVYSYNINTDKEKYISIATYLKDKEGMYAVEASGNSRDLNYIIEQHAGANLRSNYTVFVESSLTSLFQVPFKNSMTSHGRELISVSSSLSSDRNFLTKKDPHLIAERAHALGISYLVVRTEEMKHIFASSTEFALEKSFGAWNVYTTSKPSPLAEVVPREPTLVFADLGVKGTTFTSVSFFLLAEQAFIDGKYDLTLARASQPKLDTSPDLDLFQSAIVSDYKYDSLQKAEERLIAYSENHTLVLVASKDPLFENLRNYFTLNPHLHVSFVDYDLGMRGVQLSTMLQHKGSELLSYLEAHTIPIGEQPLVSASLDGKEIHLSLDSQTQKNLPVLIHSAYFPTWLRNDAQPVYLSNTAYTLTFLNSSTSTTTLTFTTPWSVYVGWLITICSVGILLLMFF